MLVLSVTLHASLALGILFSHFHWFQDPASIPPESKQSTLTLIPSQILPEPQNLAPSQPVANSVTPSLAKSFSPTPLARPQENRPADTKPTPPPVMAEANPNANVPLPKPEAVLSPIPPPPLNSREGVVFLLDVSGSMYEPFAGSTRLNMARQELARRIRALKDGTPFSLIVYAQTARRSGPLVAATNETREAAVRFIMEDYDCGGGTNLPVGLASAQELHAGQIVLVSDGDLNISQIDLAANGRKLLGAPGHSPLLSVVGIAPRSTTDAERLLQGLADQQNGNYSVEQADGATSLYSSNKGAVTMP